MSGTGSVHTALDGGRLKYLSGLLSLPAPDGAQPDPGGPNFRSRGSQARRFTAESTHAGLRLITCGGTYDAAGNTYLDNVIVLTKLKAVRGPGGW